MPTPVLRTADVVALRRLVTRGGAERTELLRSASARPIRSAKALREWHELLLFVLGHPRDRVEWELATHALQQVAALVEAWRANAPHLHEALLNSGVAGAPVEGNFSLTLVRWLLQRWPDAVTLMQVDAPLDEVRDILRTLVLPVEQELVDWGFADADALLASVFGAEEDRWLPGLIALIDARSPDERLRAHLFARLRLYVRVDGAESTCHLAAAMQQTRAVNDATHFHPTGMQRGADVTALMALPPVRVQRLGAAASQHLIDSARTVLATMGRETDPVTYASAVSLFDMGRGLTIALYALAPAYRLAFDSYVGFMAFRNGAPLAYGGAWTFPGRSKIGINIFPAQRGGESAWFFAQLLRLYHTEFDVDRFEAENYQLGYGNPEGLRSGAYWFYYRLGFRPMTAALQQLAAREFEQLTSRTAYEVPKAVLLELVEAGLEFALRDASGPVLDTAALTEAVQQHIVRRYAGDRARAMASAMRRIRALLRDGNAARRAPGTAAEQQPLRLWALPLDLVSDLESWSSRERRQLALLLQAKGAPSETRHQQLLRTHRRLLQGWARALAPTK
jgi:hypothetical protein